MTTPPVTHPMVGAYLNELDRLLAGIDPGERAEVLSGVREHLVGALAGRTAVTDEDVRGVLAELGPPQAVADEAYAGRGTGAAPTGTRPSSAPSAKAGAFPWCSAAATSRCSKASKIVWCASDDSRLKSLCLRRLCAI